jgi:signal peptidase I
MQPTLLPGDYLYVSALVSPPTRKEIVAYEHGGMTFIKRVIGLPGDTLSMQAGTVLIDGTPLPEAYASHAWEKAVRDSAFMWQRAYLVSFVRLAAYRPTLTTWGPIVVPAESYFVLGDNRGESADSRYMGFIAANSIFARPRWIYYSYDSENHRIRWSRIGMVIRDGADAPTPQRGRPN